MPALEADPRRGGHTGPPPRRPLEGPTRVSAQGEPNEMTMSTVDLRTEAAAEARRLATARALLRDGDARALVQLDGDATWIALARRTGRKRSLGRRVCLVWRVAFEDASGRMVESRLVPILIEVTRVPGKAERRAWIRSLLRHADGLVRARVEAECEAWRVAVARVASAFASARLCREREIAGQSPSSSNGASQPGLFDRRAQRSRQAHTTAAAESEQAAAERLRTISAGAAIALQPARLLLVLVP